MSAVIWNRSLRIVPGVKRAKSSDDLSATSKRHCGHNPLTDSLGRCGQVVMSHCDSVHQMADFFVNLIRGRDERGHVLAKNHPEARAHAMNRYAQSSAAHPELARDFLVEIWRIARQQRRERFELAEIVA